MCALHDLMRDATSQNHRDSASAAARIRDNQRRSRARHREFVQELKAKLDEYDRRGVQATLEMRRAARAVALENSRLRSLLASRGVTRENVEQYLASFNSQNPDDPLAVVLTPPTIQADEPPAAPSDSEPSPPPLQLRPEEDDDNVGDLESDGYLPSSDASTFSLDKLSFLAHISAQQSCCGSTTQCSAGDDYQQQENNTQTDAMTTTTTTTTTNTTNLFAEASCDLILPPSPPIATTTSSLEMSCTAAAQIIASMHQFRSEEMVREDLGCLGPDECFISNMTLFQLLDSLE